MDPDTAKSETSASVVSSQDANPSPELITPPILENKSKNQWDDYEDDTYEEGNTKVVESPSTEQNSNFQEDYDLLHSTLVHRYDREIQRMNSMKTQSVFILTALGFLITTGLAILCADWFTIKNFPGVFTSLIIIYIVPIVTLSGVSGILALNVMLRIDKNTKYEDEYFWDYPDNNTLKMSISSAPIVSIDKRVLCRTLAHTTHHNYENNKIMRKKINYALLFLMFAMLHSFVVIFIIISIHYFGVG